MTCREKLKIEHPSYVTNEGYCVGCPSHFGYLDDSLYCGDSLLKNACELCWDLEIPEEEFKPLERVVSEPPCGDISETEEKPEDIRAAVIKLMESIPEFDQLEAEALYHTEDSLYSVINQMRADCVEEQLKRKEKKND